MLERMLAEVSVYLLVFARMGGAIGINPMLSRRNVPSIARIGLVFALTLLLAPVIETGERLEGFALVVGLLKELTVGLLCGIVFQFYYYMLFFAGDFMDMQFGMSMAKVFDPGTNIQMSVSGNILRILFSLYLFASNSHLLMIRIFATSFQVVPAGGVLITENLSGFMINLFIQVFSLALRLTLPFIAVEFILEMSMGILMKLIPQIHVFVLNVQFKMILGLMMLFLFARPLGNFLDNYISVMFENMAEALALLR